MTIRGRHRLAASMLLAAMGTACGGGAGTNSTVPPTTVQPARVSTNRSTTAGSSTTSTSIGLPFPNVIDHGEDVVEVAGSLLRFKRFIRTTNPDPSLVARVYDLTSPPGLVMMTDVTEMRDIGARVVEVDSAPFDFVLISRTLNAVSLLLTEHVGHREAVAADGRILARDRTRTEHYVISMARPDPGGEWRVIFDDFAPGKIEVQL